MKYEQMITIYGKIVVEAGDMEEARDKILNALQKDINIDNARLVIGDFERVGDVYFGGENE